jgi:hypothetical protein
MHTYVYPHIKWAKHKTRKAVEIISELKHKSMEITGIKNKWKSELNVQHLWGNTEITNGLTKNNWNVRYKEEREWSINHVWLKKKWLKFFKIDYRHPS